ncbi:MAG: TM2 domain-containing protein [Bacilli bacterium]|nr:TM2 domain-containing protein [Bacilli bacterium]
MRERFPMPYCRHCHEEISKFDTDICPHCGGPKPIEKGYKTMDVTRVFGTVEGNFKMPKSRSQKTFCLLCMLLGYFGIHEFYIYRPARGIVSLLVTLAVTLGVGLPLFLTGVLGNALAFVLPFLLVWACFVGLGLYYRKVESPKDGRGEFLR